MGNSGKKNIISRFLIFSFIGLLIFSIVVFVILGIYMTRKSENAVHEVGEIYMSGMNEQMSKHFETVISLRFNQVDGIVSVVSSDNNDKESLYEELVYRARVRDFDYLALCSVDGTFETLYGDAIRPLNPAPFVEALELGEQRVAVGVDSNGKEVVLFGVSATYPMNNDEYSTGLIAAVPLDYVIDFLSLEDKGSLMYYHIIRPDGSFVIRNSNSELWDFFEGLQTYIKSGKDTSADKSVEDFYSALKDDKEYATVFDVNGDDRQVYGIPLPYSEWYLVAVMPYSTLDDTINSLSNQRVIMMLACSAAVLILFTIIFISYFFLNRAQMREFEKTRQVAVESSRAKSEFLANMSHDIRTPMNAIVGMTAIATAHMDDKEQVRNCLKKITLSSKHLLGLINDVLDMSKIESGKLALTMEEISLRDITEEIVSIMQPHVKAKKQKFDVHVENIISENVWCDGVRLNQVVLNLLSNATKYTQEGGTIYLSLREEESPKGENYIRINIRVKDNGMGMSPEFLERIYESYSRADELRIHKTEGAGLGMAITKYIVDAMEGTIDVQSELDKGTEFSMTFDFEKADSVTLENMVLPPWKVLVVDDDEMLCKTAVSSLEFIGAKAEWVTSGEEAIELVMERHKKRKDYQIILLDWKLPGMNGIQVAKEIRRNLGDEVPILLISAYDWSDFETEARQAGINGFISKPLFASTLFYSLSEHMGSEKLNNGDSTPNGDMSGRRILVAEDNELNWEVASELLSDLGAELDWAEDGKVCFDKFSNSPEGYYDAILMDLRMPNMTGYEAAKAIRALDRPDAQTVAIIAMSADAFSDDVKRCLDCGMNAHTAKPIDVTEIERLLKRFFN